MKKNLFAILMLTAVFFAASCTKDEPDAPTLTLSEIGTITVAKAASEKAVTVTTNQPEWTAMANVGWIELVQSGTTLTLKTTENTESVLRKGEVMVMAGGLGRKLLVEQSASDVTIVTIPDKLGINQWGGNFQFDVNANTKDWTVTSDADWVKVTPKQFKSEVAIEVSENTERQPRVAKLTLMGADKKGPKEFIITQSGILYYAMPCMEFGKDFSVFEKFELDRRSRLESEPSVGIPMFGIPDNPFYTFKTKSEMFTQVKYETMDLGPKFMFSAVTVAKNDEVVSNKEFKDFLKEEKYEFVSKVTTKSGYIESYINKEKKITAYVVVDTVKKRGEVHYQPIIDQEKEYKTFDTFLYGLTEFDKAKEEDINKWEANNKGTHNVGISNPQRGILAFDAPEPWILRAYFLTNSKVLGETLHFFKELNKGIYLYGNLSFLTKEFKALLAKEGFEFASYNPVNKSYEYTNKNKKINIWIRSVKWAGSNVLAYNLYKLSTTANVDIQGFFSDGKKTPKGQNDLSIYLKR